MIYELKNGFAITLADNKKEVPKQTYLDIRATGFHGDMDYNVNEEATIYFGDNVGQFKKLIAFECNIKDYVFDDLKEEYQKLFKDEDELDRMCEEWEAFQQDYSETHDESICLNLHYNYVIEDVVYYSSEVELGLFNESEE